MLVWAEEGSTFFDPVPVNKPNEGEMGGITQVGGLMCKFGRFGSTPAMYINETLVKCVTPSIDDDPDSIYRETVILSVALNG